MTLTKKQSCPKKEYQKIGFDLGQKTKQLFINKIVKIYNALFIPVYFKV